MFDTMLASEWCAAPRRHGASCGQYSIRGEGYRLAERKWLNGRRCVAGPFASG